MLVQMLQLVSERFRFGIHVQCSLHGAQKDEKGFDHLTVIKNTLTYTQNIYTIILS